MEPFLICFPVMSFAATAVPVDAMTMAMTAISQGLIDLSFRMRFLCDVDQTPVLGPFRS
jgi:hypothetical protein